MNCLFWNVGKKNKDINDYLFKLIVNYNLQLIVLAEYEENGKELLINLGSQGYNYFYHHKLACNRISIFSIYTKEKIKDLNETNYYTFKQVPHDTLGNINFCFVHFPSQMHSTENDLAIEARFLKDDIDEVERTTGSDKTVLVGDFNMNPFSEGILSAAGIHAYPTIYEANKFSKIIKSRKFKTFYNPMWNFIGDKNNPLGTYYYNSSHYMALYWNLFDQVILRPSLIPNISYKDIKILDEVAGVPLINKNGRPDVSDHLPLFFKIL